MVSFGRSMMGKPLNFSGFVAQGSVRLLSSAWPAGLPRASTPGAGGGSVAAGRSPSHGNSARPPGHRLGRIGRATAFAEGAGVAIASDDGASAFEALLRHDRAYT